MELVIAVNPDPDSSLKYLLWVPFGDGRVYRTSDTWPRTKALFCYQVDRSHWPDNPEIVERVPLRSCAGRGAAIDIIADRARESRSQIVHTTGRGRAMVFWQSPRTRKKARPGVTTPTARAAQIANLTIIVDSRERYAYSFASQQTATAKQTLAAGDYGILTPDGQLAAAVERKSLEDLISSLVSGRLGFQMADLAGLPHAAVIIEERYSQIFKQPWTRPAVVADGLAELQIRYPHVPIIFSETRKLAQEWTYRFLAAAQAALPPPPPPERGNTFTPDAEEPAQPQAAAVRRWAADTGLPINTRGRIPTSITKAYINAHRTTPPT